MHARPRSQGAGDEGDRPVAADPLLLQALTAPTELGRVMLPPGSPTAGGKAEAPSHGLLLFPSVLFLIETTRTPAGPQLQCQWSLERELGTQGP